MMTEGKLNFDDALAFFSKVLATHWPAAGLPSHESRFDAVLAIMAEKLRHPALRSAAFVFAALASSRETGVVESRSATLRVLAQRLGISPIGAAAANLIVTKFQTSSGN